MREFLVIFSIITYAVSKPNGYYHQEYNYKTSSSSFQNNELQRHKQDEGFYSKDGDIEGRFTPKVNSHSQHAAYVNPKLLNGGSISRGGSSNYLSSELFGNQHNIDGYASSDRVLDLSNIYAGGATASAYDQNYQQYGSSNYNYGSSTLDNLVRNLQNEMNRQLHSAVRNSEFSSSISRTQMSADVRMLEDELRKNLTRQIEDNLRYQRRIQPTFRYNNQEVSEITRRLEGDLVRKLHEDIRTTYGNYGNNYGTYDRSAAYTSATSTHRPYIVTTFQPTESLTQLASRAQNEINTYLDRSLNNIYTKYLQDTRNSYYSLDDFNAETRRIQDEVSRNISQHLDQQIRQAYGQQVLRDNYYYTVNSNGDSNQRYNYNVQDYENLKRQIEENLQRKLQQTVDNYREQYQRTYTSRSSSATVITPRTDYNRYTSPQPVYISDLQQRLTDGLQNAIRNRYRTSSSSSSYSSYQSDGGRGSYQPQQNYQASYDELSRELQRNLTEQLNTLRGAHGFSNYESMKSQLENQLMQQLQTGLRNQFRTYSSSASYSASAAASSNSNYGSRQSYGNYGNYMECCSPIAMRKKRDLTYWRSSNRREFKHSSSSSFGAVGSEQQQIKPLKLSLGDEEVTQQLETPSFQLHSSIDTDRQLLEPQLNSLHIENSAQKQFQTSSLSFSGNHHRSIDQELELPSYHRLHPNQEVESQNILSGEQRNYQQQSSLSYQKNLHSSEEVEQKLEMQRSHHRSVQQTELPVQKFVDQARSSEEELKQKLESPKDQLIEQNSLNHGDLYGSHHHRPLTLSLEHPREQIVENDFQDGQAIMSFSGNYQRTLHSSQELEMPSYHGSLILSKKLPENPNLSQQLLSQASEQTEDFSNHDHFHSSHESTQKLEVPSYHGSLILSKKLPENPDLSQQLLAQSPEQTEDFSNPRHSHSLQDITQKLENPSFHYSGSLILSKPNPLSAQELTQQSQTIDDGVPDHLEISRGQQLIEPDSSNERSSSLSVSRSHQKHFQSSQELETPSYHRSPKNKLTLTPVDNFQQNLEISRDPLVQPDSMDEFSSSGYSRNHQKHVYTSREIRQELEAPIISHGSLKLSKKLPEEPAIKLIKTPDDDNFQHNLEISRDQLVQPDSTNDFSSSSYSSSNQKHFHSSQELETPSYHGSPKLFKPIQELALTPDENDFQQNLEISRDKSIDSKNEFSGLSFSSNHQKHFHSSQETIQKLETPSYIGSLKLTDIPQSIQKIKIEQNPQKLADGVQKLETSEDQLLQPDSSIERSSGLSFSSHQKRMHSSQEITQELETPRYHGSLKLSKELEEPTKKSTRKPNDDFQQNLEISRDQLIEPDSKNEFVQKPLQASQETVPEYIPELIDQHTQDFGQKVVGSNFENTFESQEVTRHKQPISYHSSNENQRIEKPRFHPSGHQSLEQQEQSLENNDFTQKLEIAQKPKNVQRKLEILQKPQTYLYSSSTEPFSNQEQQQKINSEEKLIQTTTHHSTNQEVVEDLNQQTLEDIPHLELARTIPKLNQKPETKPLELSSDQTIDEQQLTPNQEIPEESPQQSISSEQQLELSSPNLKLENQQTQQEAELEPELELTKVESSSSLPTPKIFTTHKFEANQFGFDSTKIMKPSIQFGSTVNNHERKFPNTFPSLGSSEGLRHYQVSVTRQHPTYTFESFGSPYTSSNFQTGNSYENALKTQNTLIEMLRKKVLENSLHPTPFDSIGSTGGHMQVSGKSTQRFVHYINGKPVNISEDVRELKPDGQIIESHHTLPSDYQYSSLNSPSNYNTRRSNVKSSTSHFSSYSSYN